MVLFVLRYDIHPDKAEAFAQWSQGAIQRLLAVPGVVEFRAYRGVAGSSQVVVTYEFTDLIAAMTWYSNEETQKVQAEQYTLTVNVTKEIWGPSPVVPAPIRPGK